MCKTHKNRDVARCLRETALFFVPSVLLVIPFARFAKANAYPLLSAEMLVAIGGFLVAGVACGVLGRSHRLVQSFLIAAAVTLLIDVQSQLFETYSLYQYVWLPLLIWGLTYVAPRPIENLLIVVIHAMFIAVLLTPGSPPIQKHVKADSRSFAGAGHARPDDYWIHIILDGHIGIEGIPSSFDPGGRLAQRIRDDYIEKGFNVFGGAFVRFSQTHSSLPNILNFENRHPVSFLSEDSAPGYVLNDSRYLRRLYDQGFDVHVYESDYLRICGGESGKWVRSCKRYSGNSIGGLHGTPLPVVDKAMLALGMYARLSKIYSKILAELPLARRFEIPRHVAPVVALKVASEFRQDVLDAQPGSAWLLHLILPHYPYALDKQCTIRDRPWSENGGESAAYRMNTERERQLKYALYFDQLQCAHSLVQELFDTLKVAGIYEKARIVVHGDHGSRIATHNLGQRLHYDPGFIPSDRTLIDYYSTIFAFKEPGQRAGQYRREIIPVETLLDQSSAGLQVGAGQDRSPVQVNLVEWDESCSVDDVGAPGCRLLPLSYPQSPADVRLLEIGN